MSTMFFASFKDAQGNEQANLYNDYAGFYRDTFSPDCEILQTIHFSVKGKTYNEKKNHVQSLAIDFSHNDICGLSWGECAEISDFFEKNGKRYGLLKEFRENAIC